MAHCKDCKFFVADEHTKPINGSDDRGTCRRNPPAWMRANGHDDARFPPVMALSTPCGEFKREK